MKASALFILSCVLIISFFVLLTGDAAEPVKTAPLLSDCTVSATSLMRGTPEKPVPVVRVQAVWSGETAQGTVKVTAGGRTCNTRISVQKGKNRWYAEAPDTAEAVSAQAVVAIGNDVHTVQLELTPYRRFEVFIVQHTHTDIGYTADQPQVMREHLRFIDEALRCVEATKDYPAEAQFKWLCEVTWGTELFFDHRPEQAIRALKQAADAGRIELAALCLNMTDVATEEVVIRNLQPVKRFRDAGFKIVSAMQNDVNGFPWALPRMLRNIGVKYFANGINETRSKVPFDYPSALWWESPGGTPLLTWRGPHYMMGNFLGLNRDLPAAEDKVSDYFKALADQDYPHDMFLIPISGLFTDNSPPTLNVCNFIKSWNEKWAYPRLRTSTLKDFFTRFEKQEKGTIPRYRKAWCDWWADGIGAGADELALVKKSQESMAFSDLLFSVSGFGLGAGGERFRDELSEAYRTALLFDEHTYGAYNSISQPYSLRAKHGWLYKSSFAASLSWDSALIEDAALSGLIWDIPTETDPVLAVVNPLPWKRTCFLSFKLPRSVVESMRPFKLLATGSGEELCCQQVGEETLWIHMVSVVPDVPACGYRTFRVVSGAPSGLKNDPFGFSEHGLTNGKAAVKVDPETGALTMLSVRGNQLIEETGSPYGFGQYIYEQIDDPKDRGLLWPRGQTVPFKRSVPGEITIKQGKKGPVAASLIVEGKLADDHTVRCEVTLWKGADWIDLSYTIHKPGTLKGEGVYIAFPFQKELMPLRAEVPGSLMEPGADQIPKSASDWHCIQNFVTAGTSGNGPLGVWVTHDAPLIHFGGLNMGKYRDLVEIKEPVFYSWPMNNYWFTNFPAEQEGEFLFRYAAGAAKSDEAAYRFSRERTFRPRGVLLPRNRRGRLPAESASFLTADTCLDSVKPAEDGRGFIVRLRNHHAEEKQAKVTFSDLVPVAQVQAVNLLEEPARRKITLINNSVTVSLAPFDACDLRIITKTRRGASGKGRPQDRRSSQESPRTRKSRER